MNGFRTNRDKRAKAHRKGMETPLLAWVPKRPKLPLISAGSRAQEIDLFFLPLLSPDYYFPGSGVLVQELLIFQAAPLWTFGINVLEFYLCPLTADQFIKTGMYQNILVIGSEYHSGGLDMTTRGRNISVIFMMVPERR